MSEINKISKKIHRVLSSDINISESMGAVKLEGKVSSWNDVIKAGKIAAKSQYRGVINNLYVDGINDKKVRRPKFEDKKLDGLNTDVLIIGGGIIGSAIARELSKYNIDILLVDKESDLGLHQSSRNDGMVHPGVMPHPGTKKAYYNVHGNEMFEELAKEVNVPYRTVGTYVMFENRLIDILGRFLLIRAKKNNVKGVRHVSYKEIKLDEPNIPNNIKGSIYMPTTGVCPPYEMTVALAESAVINGAKVSLSTMVTDINKKGDKIESVDTNRGRVFPKTVINAAGLFSDTIAELAGDRFFTIHPRKGLIALLDKEKAVKMDSVMSIVSFKSAFSNTKGGGLVKTADGNILVGPSAHEEPYKEDYSTEKADLDLVLDKNLGYINGINRGDVITYLAGNRAATYKEDFIVEPSKYVNNLIHAAGIQSPGYASSPAIAKDVCDMALKQLSDEIEVKPKEHFVKERKGIINVADLDDDTRNDLIKERRDYGEIICRCEQISRGEILDAIKSPIPALTVDAIKRRTRAGMGRCQGGFCRPLIAKIISQETGHNFESILHKGGDEL